MAQRQGLGVADSAVDRTGDPPARSVDRGPDDRQQRTRRSTDRAGRAAPISRAILRDLFGPPRQRPFAVRLWDGSVEVGAAEQPPRFTLVLRRPGALRRMFLPPSELAIGEAYVRDDLDIEGDIEEAGALAAPLVERLRSPATLARLVPRLLALPADDLPRVGPGNGGPSFQHRGRRHSLERDAAAVRFHYDAGNDFFALWLDRRMMYTTAYFRTGTEDVDTAQEAKLERVCRKLRLRPGERLLDVGCGWGGLIQYAAERYGVQAVGITLNEPQAELARGRIAAAGLSDRCHVEVCDYRDFRPESGFDKVVSLEMYEHLGRAQVPAYFSRVHRFTRPSGLFLFQANVDIVRASWAQRLFWRQGQWVRRYVWPDTDLLTTGEAIRCAEQAGFEARDQESIREHAALTFRHWRRRLEARRAEAIDLVGEPRYRAWRLYLAVTGRGYAVGDMGSVQVLFGKPDRDGSCRIPLTRADLCGEPSGPMGRRASVGAND